jgi:acetyl-CoA carboxylase carboxyltransferase component
MAGEPGAGPHEPSKLEAVRQARRAPLDEARPAAIARHKAKGRLTARQNVADLLDARSFVEYGLLARPAREGMEGAADGLVMGTGTVDGLAVAAVAYDYTVHAGTRSAANHLLTHATTPFMTVVQRKAHGLGYYVMGSRPLEPTLLLAWPTAESGGMGLEGAVNIIHKKELDAIADAPARAALHRHRTEALKHANTAPSATARFDVDDVTDPADTRRLLAQTLARLPVPPARAARKHPVDPF